MKRLLCVIFITLLLVGCRKTPQASEQQRQDPAPRADLEKVPARDEGKVSPKDEAKTTPQPKAPVVLTAAAADKLRKLQQEDGFKYLRISVRGPLPDSGDFERKLHLDNQYDPKEDYLSESRGITIVVDKRSSLFLLTGTTLDYVDAGGERGFKFSNPVTADDPIDKTVSLTEARQKFKTKLTRQVSAKTPVATPPEKVFRIVHYEAPTGKLAAYLTPDPKDGKKHPAIIWITGGDCNTIDTGCWNEGPPANDQSASAFRKAGIVMMFPSLRGGNDNPGFKEAFLGEVDDILAAADYLSKQDFVDPHRIYLGGHSTGGTMVLLTAECSDRFRAVFSFGPVEDVLGYGLEDLPFSFTDRQELRVRAPGRWLHSIRSPVFVLEGTSGGNLSSLQAMARTSQNPNVHFLEVKGATHFSTLAPLTKLIAEKILRDNGDSCNLAFTEEEVSKPFKK